MSVKSALPTEAPAPMPEPHWEPLPIPAIPPQRGRNFVTGDPGGPRVRVAFFRERGTDGTRGILAKAWFGRDAEGPPGHAHGGSLAAVLDEVMGIAVWCAGVPAVAGRLTTHFRGMVPIGGDYTVAARVAERTGRKVLATGEILCPATGKVLAEGEALYVMLDGERLRALGRHAAGGD